MRFKYQLHRLLAITAVAYYKLARKRCIGYLKMRPHFEGRCGLEFGGPSSIFSANNLVPVYDVARVVDNCNFAPQTLWTRDHERRFGQCAGKKFIADACDPSCFEDQSYDFVIASHMLEHVANPLRALKAWKRILRTSGTILLVLPHKAGTFDHSRPNTTIAHVRGDFEAGIPETDLSHLDEILSLTDRELDPGLDSAEEFRNRCLKNASNRAMHHHVFTAELLVEMFSFLNMRVLNVAVHRPYHIIIQAQKMNAAECSGAERANEAFSRPDAAWRKYDPFPTLC